MFKSFTRQTFNNNNAQWHIKDLKQYIQARNFIRSLTMSEPGDTKITTTTKQQIS